MADGDIFCCDSTLKRRKPAYNLSFNYTEFDFDLNGSHGGTADLHHKGPCIPDRRGDQERMGTSQQELCQRVLLLRQHP